MRNAGTARMERTNDVDSRLTELEIKASLAEDLLETLNAMVARQQEAIEMLAREIARFQQQQASSADGTPSSLRDELPPHY
jgi:SlyX protein